MNCWLNGEFQPLVEWVDVLFGSYWSYFITMFSDVQLKFEAVLHFWERFTVATFFPRCFSPFVVFFGCQENTRKIKNKKES